MPRGSTMERQPVLFPMGEYGPPDGPGDRYSACADGADDDQAVTAVLAAMAWLWVVAYTRAQVADMDATGA